MYQDRKCIEGPTSCGRSKGGQVVLALMAVLILMTAQGSAQAGIIRQLATVPLSHVPTELTPLDPGGVLDLVPVYLCDREPYASFFFETAKVHGTLALADTLTSRFGRTLAEAAAGAYEVSQSDPETWPDVAEKVARDRNTSPDALSSLREQSARMELMLGPLMALGERVPHLVSQAASLTELAPGAFPGITGKLKLVRVVNAVRGAVGQLHSAGTSSVRTVRNIQGIVAAVRP